MRAVNKPATITTVTECGSLARLKAHLKYLNNFPNVKTIVLDESPIDRGMKAEVTLVHTYEKYHNEEEEARETGLTREILDPNNIAMEKTELVLYFPVTVTHTVVTSGHADPIKLSIL